MRIHQPVRQRRLAGAPDGEHDVGGMAEDSLADVVERMFGLFDTQLSLTTIVRVVRRCRRELDIVSGPPLGEVLERLAQQRLTSFANATGHDARLA